MSPGVYAEFREHSGTPEGFVFGAGWATVRPFTLSRPDRFRVGPRPAIDSAQYTQAFEEVKEIGSFTSRTGTADQTHLAMWWKEFVESSHNRLARQLVASDRLDRELDEAGPLSGKIRMDPSTRSFESLPAAALECSLSRVYLGIHFRYDSLAGNELGNAIGRYAVGTFLSYTL